MTARLLTRTAVTALALCSLAAGCLSQAAPRSYVLAVATAAPPSPALGAAGSGPAVGVGPIRVPAYLDRPSLVVRAGADEVTLSPDHRWAESLADGIARVMAGNLSLMIPTNAVAIFPWRTPWTVQYRVTMEILRFDGPLSGPVVLDARWRLLDAGGQEMVLKAVNLSEPVPPPPTYAGLVAAQSQLLARVGQDVAAEIRRRAR